MLAITTIRVVVCSNSGKPEAARQVYIMYRYN
eukprot:SAG22_NODE_20796_length_262_cov_1.276074_1_plen_31_part_10